MEKLHKLRELALEELEKFAGRGLSTGTTEVAKNLASLVCKLDCIEQQEESYSERYSRRYHDDGMGGIGMPAYTQRRGSMGRFSHGDGYSYHGGELERAIEESGLREETKRELKRLLERG